MKTSSSQGFYSTIFVVSTVLLMFAGYSTASPVCVVSPEIMKSFIHAHFAQLSKTVGETQADFAQVRLGDRNYDGYVHSISQLPRPIYHPEKLQEEALLEMEIKDLYAFKEFIREIKTHEKKDSLFLDNFQKIDDDINILISYIQDLERCRGYVITHQGAFVQPTSKPAATQKEQDEWDLGVLKELLYWFIPVQGELYQQLKNAK